MKISILLLIAACVFLSDAVASEDNPAVLSRDEQATLASKAFLDAHPDLKYQQLGWAAYQEGRFEEAIDHFEQAASYADKLSQAMLAEMYWNGQGVPVDRPLAYAWADLAAERGYVQFLGLRERYWQALDAGGRTEAIERGQALLHEYGDAVARPRMAEALRKALWDVRRTSASMMIRRDSTFRLPAGSGGAIEVQGGAYYAEKFWRPERYQAWQDEFWSNPPPTGTVTVRPLETVRDVSSREEDSSAPAAPRSEDTDGQDTDPPD